MHILAEIGLDQQHESSKIEKNLPKLKRTSSTTSTSLQEDTPRSGTQQE